MDWFLGLRARLHSTTSHARRRGRPIHTSRHSRRGNRPRPASGPRWPRPAIPANRQKPPNHIGAPRNRLGRWSSGLKWSGWSRRQTATCERPSSRAIFSAADPEGNAQSNSTLRVTENFQSKAIAQERRRRKGRGQERPGAFLDRRRIPAHSANPSTAASASWTCGGPYGLHGAAWLSTSLPLPASPLRASPSFREVQQPAAQPCSNP